MGGVNREVWLKMLKRHKSRKRGINNRMERKERRESLNCLTTEAGFWQILSMPCQKNHEFTGASHPGPNRGDRRGAHYRDGTDRREPVAVLGRRAKGDAGKGALAVRLRAETVMTVQWIAERLHRGSPGDVNLLLSRKRKRI